MAGEIGHGFAFPAPDHQGLEAGQFVGIEGLIVAEIEVQAADAQGVGQENFGGGPGFRDPFGAEIVGGPPEDCQDGPGGLGAGHLRLGQGLGAIVSDQGLEEFIQVAVQGGLHFKASRLKSRSDGR